MARPVDARGGRSKDTGPNINRNITSEEVRLIDETGENVGVVSLEDALSRAVNLDLDLVEIVPNAKPPVVKIMNYGKYKYQEQKKAAEAKKKQQKVELKEIKVRPNIDTHDYDVKLKAARRFIEEGNKVKVTLRFRGREIAHSDLGLALLKRIQADIEDISKTDQAPKMEGRLGIMILSPK
ncbi:MAG: translation initiation factor IF-3 [Pseudomonadota bacterium]